MTNEKILEGFLYYNWKNKRVKFTKKLLTSGNKDGHSGYWVPTRIKIIYTLPDLTNIASIEKKIDIQPLKAKEIFIEDL